MQHKEFAEFICDLAERSAELILPFFMSPDLVIEEKSDRTPVTLADRGAELLLRDLIAKRYPSHGVIGEEFGRHNADAEHVWMLDPVDGTKSFAAGCPLFGTLIALLRGGVPILGAVNLPAMGKLCIGDGESCELNGRGTRMRTKSRLAEATVCTTDIAAIARKSGPAVAERLYSQPKLFQTWGDCFGYVLLAAGLADVMLDTAMNPWDIMPLIPIIRGAGGVITGWDGEEAVGAQSAVAAAPGLHPQIMKLLHD